MFLSLLQQKILMTLGNKKMTRGELVAILGVPRTTLHDNLRKLYVTGYVDRTEVSNGERGRPLVYWDIMFSNIFEKSPSYIHGLSFDSTVVKELYEGDKPRTNGYQELFGGVEKK